MGKIFLEKNVLEAAFERLEFIFRNFENVYFSVSGGKDSSVMVQLANIIAKKLDKKFDVLYIDFEAQYKHTIQHIEELKQLPQIRDFYHIALPIALRNAVSVLQPKWICWEEESKHLWVRDMPEDAINIKNCPTIENYKTTCMNKYINVDKANVLNKLMINLDKWRRAKFIDVRARWMELAAGLNSVVKYRGDIFELIGINENGALILRRGTQYMLAYGDEITM